MDLEEKERRLQEAKAAFQTIAPSASPPGQRNRSRKSSPASTDAQEVYGSICYSFHLNLVKSGKSQAFFRYADSMMEHGKYLTPVYMSPEGHFDLVIKALNNVAEETGPQEDNREFLAGFIRGERPDWSLIPMQKSKDKDEDEDKEEEDDSAA
jgi:hypothetical protein